MEDRLQAQKDLPCISSLSKIQQPELAQAEARNRGPQPRSPMCVAGSQLEPLPAAAQGAH